MAASTSIASVSDSADGWTRSGAESRLRIPIGDEDCDADAEANALEIVVIVVVSWISLADLSLRWPELSRSPLLTVSVKSSAL